MHRVQVLIQVVTKDCALCDSPVHLQEYGFFYHRISGMHNQRAASLDHAGDSSSFSPSEI
jgi:hypothetical protein